MAEIFRHIPRGVDQKLGAINPRNGHVFSERLGPNDYIGRVDYQDGKVYRHRFGPDEYLGRVDSDGRVYAHRFGPDEYLGRVNADGSLYLHNRLARDDYLGTVRGMQHPVEGAAALLLFFRENDETPTDGKHR